MLETPSLDVLRQVITSVLPEFGNSALSILNAGGDSVGVEADGQWIFKFPRHPEAEARLRKECRILTMVRHHADLPVPDMVLYEAPRLFSRHRKLPGQFLETVDYILLTERQRDAIAEKLAGHCAALHAIPHDEARAAGATPVEPWMTPEQIVQAAPYLPPDLQARLDPALEFYSRIQPEADEAIYGHFDGHGWNMAFDAETGTLNGVYDFADSGFGARHQDLSYTNWISRDLTLRIIGRYERLTGRSIDRGRVMLYTEVLRFVEFADAAPDRDDLPDRLAALRSWFGEAAA